jgi:hypothetical protein
VNHGGVVVITGTDREPVVVAATNNARNAGRFLDKAMKLHPAVTDPLAVAANANLLAAYGAAATGSAAGVKEPLLIDPAPFARDAVAAYTRQIHRLRAAGYDFATWTVDTDLGIVRDLHGQGAPSRRCRCP